MTDEPTTHTIVVTCPTKGCDDSRMMAIPIGTKLADLGELSCTLGHRMRYLPTGQAEAIDEQATP